jgi:hypothetical protein
MTYPLRLSEIRLCDPFILVDQATQKFYLYAENDPSLSGQAGSGTMVFQSQNLRDWSVPAKVYSIPDGGWADPTGRATAPEVHLFRGKYYLLTTLQNSEIVIAAAQKAPNPGSFNGLSIWQNQTAKASVIAVAGSPLGPFLDLNSAAPLTNPRYMTLHATLHADPDGSPWMVYARDWVQKVDGTIEAVRLTEDLSAMAGSPVYLFKGSDAPWYDDPIGGAPPGRQLVNDLQDPPYATINPQVYRTPNRSLIMLWSSYRRHFTEYIQTQAISRTGHIAGPWEQLAPVVTGDRGSGMIFRAFDTQLVMSMHEDTGQATRVQLYDIALTDDGVEILRHRRDLDGTVG